MLDIASLYHTVALCGSCNEPWVTKKFHIVVVIFALATKNTTKLWPFS